MNNNPTSNPFLTRSHRAVVDALWDNMVHTQNPHYGDFRKNTGGYLEGSQWKPIQLLRSSVSKTQNFPNKGYNNKGEVVKADHNNNAFDKSYDFDGIGNRNKTADSLTLPAANNYVSNALNQYSNVNGVARTYDADGNSLAGVVGTRGQLGEIKWDGNNRLTEVTTADGKLVKVDYDHMGRRFRKSVTTGGETKNSYFIYSGYNAIAKYTGNSQSALSLQKSYYWGLDLGGGEGTGGMLAEVKHLGTDNLELATPQTLFALMDGNGNITEYLKSDGTMAAHFEYDSFGNTLVSEGAEAGVVDYGFSSRAKDKDLGLIYYNWRWYNSVQGGWIDRDPIEEWGGLSVYGFLQNNAVNNWDYLGFKGCECLSIKVIRQVSEGGKWLDFTVTPVTRTRPVKREELEGKLKPGPTVINTPKDEITYLPRGKRHFMKYRIRAFVEFKDTPACQACKKDHEGRLAKDEKGTIYMDRTYTIDGNPVKQPRTMLYGLGNVMEAKGSDSGDMVFTMANATSQNIHDIWNRTEVKIEIGIAGTGVCETATYKYKDAKLIYPYQWDDHDNYKN